MKSLKVVYMCILFVLVLLNSVTFAVDIADVSGSIENGEVIVITGSGFGAKPSAMPLLSSYDNAAAANNFSSGSIGGDWTTRGNTMISSSDPRTGFYQGEYYADAPYITTDYSQLRYDAPLNAGSYFYTSIWYKITADLMCVSTSSSNSKFWRWYVNPTGTYGGTVSENFSGGSQGACPADSLEADVNNAGHDGGQGDLIDYLSPVIPSGEWFHHEVWVYAGANDGTDGRYVEKVNGNTIRDWTSWGIINSSYPHTINALRFGQVSGYNHAGGSILVSEVYIDNTQAHVFVSDSSTMPQNWLSTGNASHDEVQVCSSWSDASLTCTFNQGTFAPGQTVYVYVADNDGLVNTSGFPITIGQSGGGGGGSPGENGSGESDSSGDGGCFINSLAK